MRERLQYTTVKNVKNFLFFLGLSRPQAVWVVWRMKHQEMWHVYSGLVMPQWRTLEEGLLSVVEKHGLNLYSRWPDDDAVLTLVHAVAGIDRR